MKDSIREYTKTLREQLENISVTTEDAKAYPFDQGISLVIDLIFKGVSLGAKLLFIGNGASASISSHMATDFWKNAGVRAVSFNDSSLLTCVSNDFGYQYVFEKPIKAFSEPQDILLAISSSGESENILNGVKAAKEKGLKVITFSGFKPTNPLRALGDVNFYIPIEHYGHVETLHSFICHCLVDMIIKAKNG